MVVEVKPFGLHGVTYYDVTVEFADRTVEQARLGPEGVPDAWGKQTRSPPDAGSAPDL